MKGVLPLSRTTMLTICALAPTAAGTALVLIATANGGTARATGLPTTTPGDYSAFNTSAAGDASSSAPPSASAGLGDGPVAGSMTKLPLGKANLSVMIAKSSEGGVCVFVERAGAKGAGGSCAPASLLSTGTQVEVHGEANGKRTVAGVVPDGVSAVKVGFAGGVSQTVPVVDNGWAIEDAPASMTSASDVVGG
jgi:hypothetical protein